MFQRGATQILGLLARQEPANLRHRQPQILIGIHRNVVDADFVVEMRAGGASALADVAERIAAVNVLSGCDGKA